MSARRRRRKPGASRRTDSGMMDDLRQLLRSPPEWRIRMPGKPLSDEAAPLSAEPEQPSAPSTAAPGPATDEAADAGLDRFVCEAANALWYLKTRFFRRRWDSQETDDEDPRVRRALGRLNRGIDALARAGAELQDPVQMRYPAGAEGLMRPIQHQPVPGLTYDIVTETVTPIIFRYDRLIQRGEVFVGVPAAEPPAEA